jgi:hypothetical protein
VIKTTGPLWVEVEEEIREDFIQLEFSPETGHGKFESFCQRPGLDGEPASPARKIHAPLDVR